MDFESYLTSKRIDSARFQAAEPEVWQSWRVDFGQMHPNSFTVQKLNLINPIRRKYQLTVIDPPKVTTPESGKVASAPAAKVAAPGPKIAAPVAKPAAPASGGAAVKIPRPGMPKITKPAAADPEETVVPKDPAVPVNTEPNTTTAQTEGTRAADTNNDTTSKADVSTENSDAQPTAEKPTPPPAAKPPRPVIPRPVIKPKPKTD